MFVIIFAIMFVIKYLVIFERILLNFKQIMFFQSIILHLAKYYFV